MASFDVRRDPQSQEALPASTERSGCRWASAVAARALGARAPMAIPQDQNLRWSLDFVMDTLVSGRRFRTQRSAGNRRSLGGDG